MREFVVFRERGKVINSFDVVVCLVFSFTWMGRWEGEKGFFREYDI